FAGRHFQVTDAVCEPKPVQKPGPPIMLGGSGNGILRRAGAWADIIHMVPVIGAAGTTTMEEIRRFDDDGLPERLARVRAAETKPGRLAACVSRPRSSRSFPPRRRHARARAPRAWGRSSGCPRTPCGATRSR